MQIFKEIPSMKKFQILFHLTFSIDINKTIPKQNYNPKASKQIAGKNNKRDDKDLNEELAKGMVNPSHFTKKVGKAGFHITLDSDHIIHIYIKLTIMPKYLYIEKFMLMKF